MTQEVLERRKTIWMSWLELPWDIVRADLIEQMHRARMSHEDLVYELRAEGFKVTSRTVGNWLSGRTRDGSAPTMDAMQALVQVFARVSVGDWAKGRLLSIEPLAYAS